MRVSCTECGAKFNLPDDKLSGRTGTVKVKCPSCSTILPVELKPAEPGPATEEREKPIWYYMVGENQEGPVPRAILVDRLKSGLTGPEDMVWKSGMDDWTFVQDIPELVQVLAGQGKSTARDTSEYRHLTSTDENNPVDAARTLLKRVKDEEEDDGPRMGDGTATLDMGASGLFDDADREREQEEGEDVVEDDTLLHTRHDTSVLFSLDDLAGNGEGDKESASSSDRRDGSGLIDIRDIALDSGEEEDVFGAFGSEAAPFVSDRASTSLGIPLVRQRKRWPLVLGIVLGSAVVLAAGAFAAITFLSGVDVAGKLIPEAVAKTNSYMVTEIARIQESSTAAAEQLEAGQEEELKKVAKAHELEYEKAQADATGLESKRKQEWETKILALQADVKTLVEKERAEKEALNRESKANEARLAEFEAAKKAAEEKVALEEAAAAKAKEEQDRLAMEAAAAKAKNDRESSSSDKKRDKEVKKTEKTDKQTASSDKTASSEKKVASTEVKAEGEKKSAADLLAMVDKKKKDEASSDNGSASSGTTKKTLTMSDITKTVKGAKSDMADCFSKHGGGLPSARISTRVTIQGSGKVSAVSIASKEYAGTALGACVKKNIQKLSFPAFTGEPVVKPITVLLP